MSTESSRAPAGSFPAALQAYCRNMKPAEELFSKAWPAHNARGEWSITPVKKCGSDKEQYYKECANALSEGPVNINMGYFCRVIQILNTLWTDEQITRKDLKLRGTEAVEFSSKVKGWQWLSNFFPTIVSLGRDAVFLSAEEAYQSLKGTVLETINKLPVADDKSCAAATLQLLAHIAQGDTKVLHITQNRETAAVTVAAASAVLSSSRAAAAPAALSSAHAAKKVGRRLEMPDHIKITSMWYVLLMKFEGNPRLKELLLATNERTLMEATDSTFWGIGAEGDGKNVLGKLLEALRAHFKEHPRCDTDTLPPPPESIMNEFRE